MYSVRLLMMDGETVRNMQSPNPKKKIEILVHLVGFIIRMRANLLGYVYVLEL